MKTFIEMYYLRIMKDTVRYQRKLVDLSQKGEDPDALIQALIQRKQKLQTSAGEVHKEFVIHSTSWRYEPPSKIVLTYIAYSDELQFGKGSIKNLPLKEVRKINIATGKPRSKEGLEKQVIAHAMRHISFLIKTDYAGEFKDAFTPRTRNVFKSLWVSLAGRSAF
ncbi:MAG: hypothetical protein H7Y59_12345 [Anaerolineales bacterium]|nr:hypothetical protein [Anaerolineales bacterium]